MEITKDEISRQPDVLFFYISTLLKTRYIHWRNSAENNNSLTRIYAHFFTYRATLLCRLVLYYQLLYLQYARIPFEFIDSLYGLPRNNYYARFTFTRLSSLRCCCIHFLEFVYARFAFCNLIVRIDNAENPSCCFYPRVYRRWLTVNVKDRVLARISSLPIAI